MHIKGFTKPSQNVKDINKDKVCIIFDLKSAITPEPWQFQSQISKKYFFSWMECWLIKGLPLGM